MNGKIIKKGVHLRCIAFLFCRFIPHIFQFPPFSCLPEHQFLILIY
ncbi:hypothetical protein CHCC14814_4322 [Bacillus paralicheniformis]|nr:hypothetical protein CHCC14814_4322 [Bacillus paralicheniformis]